MMADPQDKLKAKALAFEDFTQAVGQSYVELMLEDLKRDSWFKTPRKPAPLWKRLYYRFIFRPIYRVGYAFGIFWRVLRTGSAE